MSTRYHVFTGIGGGYLPNSAESYDTTRGAQAALRAWKEDMYDFAADAVDDNEPIRIRGAVKDGRVYAESGMGWVRTCWMETCNDPACELCGAGWFDY